MRLSGSDLVLARSAAHAASSAARSRPKQGRPRQGREAARQLGARLQRHQAALAASLTAAIDRGAGLLAEVEDRRRRRTRQLERAAELLQDVGGFASAEATSG
jgi:hypothetical protein